MKNSLSSASRGVQLIRSSCALVLIVLFALSNLVVAAGATSGRYASIAKTSGNINPLYYGGRNAHALPSAAKVTASATASSNNFLIAFTAAISIDFGGIYIMRADGTDLRQITRFKTLIFDFEAHGLNLPDDHPAFSPDGARLVFTSSREDGDFEIYVMNVNGINVRRLTFSRGIDTEPVFSPDGTKIAFASQRGDGELGIYVMDADGSNVRKVVDGPLEEDEPAWSPDGTMLAFTRVQGDNQKDVFVINADGTNERQITRIPGEDHDATFSPDGTELVITSERNGTLPFGDVFRVRLSDGAFLQNLTSSLKQGGGDPAWSPDGTQVAFFKSLLPVLVATEMFVVNADGSNPHQVADAGLINVHPNWGPIADVDGDGKPDYQQGNGLPGSDADLSIQLSASPDPVVTGSTIAYTATVRNFGPSVAQDVNTLFVIPSGTSFASAASSQGSCSTETINGQRLVRCSLGSVGIGQAATTTIAVNVDCSLTTGATIEALDVLLSGSFDTDSSNNRAMVARVTTGNRPPRIACPANITMNVVGQATGSVVVNFANPAVTDDLPGATVTCSPQSGSSLPQGTTTVTCTATDLCGATASCSFTVTVNLFDVCLQDDSNGNLLLLNSVSGAYLFTRCSDHFTLAGIGTVSIKGSMITLQHTPADRRVLARIDNSVHKGTASVQVFSPGVTLTITDRSTTNNTCSCP